MEKKGYDVETNPVYPYPILYPCEKKDGTVKDIPDQESCSTCRRCPPG
jgi:hypothetical protein